MTDSIRQEKIKAAHALMNENKYVEAMPILEALSKEFQESRNVLMLSALCNQNLGNIDQAETLFKRAVARAPKHEKASMGLFFLYHDEGRFGDALRELLRFQEVSFSQDYKEMKDRIIQEWGSVDKYLSAQD